MVAHWSGTAFERYNVRARVYHSVWRANHLLPGHMHGKVRVGPNYGEEGFIDQRLEHSL